MMSWAFAWRTIAASLAALVLLCGGAGCGGSGSNATIPPPLPRPSVNGNFNITTTSQGANGINHFGGALQTDSAGHVTGTVHVAGPLLLCFGVQLHLPLAGSIDSNGRLTATITTSNGQTLALSAQVSPNGALLSGGAYTGSGTGCANGDQGTVSGFQVQAFTGTYSGSFTPSPGTTINLVIPLTQSTTPDANGQFPVSTGTITVSGGSSCGLTSLTVDTTLSSVFGNELALVFSDTSGATMTYAGTTPDGTTNTVHGAFFIDSGPCSSQLGASNLTRP